MASGRLIDVDGDELSVVDDRELDRESLYDLELQDIESNYAQSSRAAQASKALEFAEERDQSEEDGFLAASSRQGEVSSVVVAPPDYFAAIASDGASSTMDSSWVGRAPPQSMSDTGLLSQDRVERGEIYGPSPEGQLATELKVVGGQLWRLLSDLWRIFREYVQTAQQKRGRRFGITKRMTRFIIATLTVVIILAISLPFIIKALIRHHDYVQLERERHPYRDHPVYKRDPYRDHPSTEQCTFDTFSEYRNFNGLRIGQRYSWEHGYDDEADDLPSFSLSDALDTSLPEDFVNPQISGMVEIISVPRNVIGWGSDEITVRIHTATTKDWKIVRGAFVEHESPRKVLQSPDLKRAKNSDDRSSDSEVPEQGMPAVSCLDVWVGVYIPVGMEITNWLTKLRHLSFVDRRGYIFDTETNGAETQQPLHGAIRVQNSTVIQSNRGLIDVSYWNSHQTKLESRGGDVRGKWSFYDVLDIKTLGGSLDVSIDPLGGGWSPDNPQSPKLTTSTGSGSTTLTLLEPPEQEWTPHFLQSKHTTTSGFLKLQYPEVWAGTIDGVTQSDSVDVRGKEVHENEAGQKISGEFHMMKGNRASDWVGALGKIDLESENGKIELKIG